jgi:hypothetical protein
LMRPEGAPMTAPIAAQGVCHDMSAVDEADAASAADPLAKPSNFA